ncbi:prestalk protein-like [Orbicella faveolata]|uniref:prestalk protein-like n=1 Tax=Orbicella faveolata TaxID=48498 RepID=UPI0009E51B8F|nr:prestalk protein-like [Orbicella faveolata]
MHDNVYFELWYFEFFFLTDVNECLKNPCQHTCTNTHGSFTCRCHSCYTKVGLKCYLRQCKINNQCYSYGSVNPSNQCQDCNSANKLAWTNNNALRCNDNVACTKNDRCSNGACSGTPFTCLVCEECYNDACRVKAGFCVINDGGTRKCFKHGAVRPGYPCQDCNSANNLAWTNNNALSCSDNKACTKNDRCSNGVCSGTPFTCLLCEECYKDTCHAKPGFCAISDGGTRKCVNGGAYRPGYPCQWCYPCNSSSTWSNLDGVACDDDNKCTRGDTCKSGQCVATPFTCNSVCHYCNGNGCSLKAGYGFVNNTCTCKIAGQDYSHKALNPSNQCQWCDLYDAAARGKSTWSNCPGGACDDQDKCTKQDTCNAGRCVGKGYSCQSSYPSSSCKRTSECVGDGTCRVIMRSRGTICRPAVDVCDQPERCDGSLGTCPHAVKDKITLTTGTVQLMDHKFKSVVSYQYFTDKLYLKISGFCVSCGQLTLKWFLLPSTSTCSTTSTVSGTFPNNNLQQTLTGLTLQVNRRYKVSIQAYDMRNNAAQLVCTGVVIIKTSNQSTG